MTAGTLSEPARVAAGGPYRIGSGQLLRLLTRQLFGYRTGAVDPAPDVALEIPTVENGGLSEDGRTYRLRLRRGVFWDAQGARELTAGDIVRGLKRVAHPTAAHARRYLTATIEGMREYCAAYDARFAGTQPTAPDLAQFQAAHEVSGVRAPDPHTVELRLAEPANDLPHILATGVAAAAPREYDYYLPDSPAVHRNAPSAGPYRVSRRLSRGPDLVLEPNPRWDPRTDPLRRRGVDLIRLAPGTGPYELIWPAGTAIWGEPDDTVPGPPGYGLGPYLIVNLGEGRRDAPVSRPAVRRALACAVDRAAVLASYGRASVIQHGLLPPGTLGHRAAPPLAPDGGDPARARRELAAAGFPGGVGLTLAIQDTESDRRIAVVLRETLARAGIILRVLDGPDAARWDLNLRRHTPDWYGTNGRTAVEPLVRGGAEPGAANLGRYNNPIVDRLMDYALRDPDAGRAADLWRRVEAMVMADLPIIPLLTHLSAPGDLAAGAVPSICWFAT